MARYHIEVANRLARSGAADITIACGMHHSEFLGRALVPEVRVLGRRKPLRSAAGPIYAAVDKAWLYSVGAIGGPWDIYHPTYYPRRPYRPRGARLVVTIYDMIDELFSENERNEQTAARKKQIVSRADLVLCISECTAHDLSAIYGVERARIRVTPLGVSLREHAAGARASAQSRPTTRPYVLYVGKRQGYKNFVALLNAFASLPSLRARCDIVCFGGGPLSSGEAAAAREAGVQLRYAAGSDIELAMHYQNAEALVVTSKYEGFGLTLVEAMALGCPVIANDAGSIPEVVGEAGLLVGVADPGSLASAIERVVSDETTRASMIARGRRRSELFTWEATARQTLAAYQEVTRQ